MVCILLLYFSSPKPSSTTLPKKYERVYAEASTHQRSEETAFIFFLLTLFTKRGGFFKMSPKGLKEVFQNHLTHLIA